jgi:hypothetical protein
MGDRIIRAIRMPVAAPTIASRGTSPVTALWGATANNVLNVYTAGLGLLALGVHMPRWLAVYLVRRGAVSAVWSRRGR